MLGNDGEAATSRRRFLRVGGISLGAAAAACSAPPPPAPAPTAQVAPAPAAPGWQREWDELVAAAKKEGRVSVMIRAGAGYRKWMEAFGDAFPEIQVEQQTYSGGGFVSSKVTQEQHAGVFSYDIFIAQLNTLFEVRDAGAAIASVKPLLSRPDVLDARSWQNGFDAGWMDNAKEYCYAFMERVGGALALNTDLVAPGEIKSATDLLQPKWKGKIFWTDVRTGFGYAPLIGVRQKLGEEVMRRLLVDSEVAFSRDTRQIAEAVIRGRYAVGVGVSKPVLQPFWDEGLGKNVKLADVEYMGYITSTDALCSLPQPPHPSAAKLLANWILTKQGQEAYTKNVSFNSRRTDVAPADPEDRPIPGRYYPRTSTEDSQPEGTATQRKAVEILNLKD